ncbi:2-oxo-4-hydroxy-4-carboxy-5-ureidoimidazoline decarboxylase [Microbacterium sp. LRZ72]|uniref:2-oxo-4-hydroxy-4-carboxy-5-ureidoimidazoline decarboxylase n=1 Tax=Microbacterium sp. LRZ72 TaxID=2942481 RepID=UPI0029A1DD98|nr:2-oxo-4-hydroxy-4-carboxy-5-ureidoimidazoline decarboxylase [Microbacterium sp. LRZ72]MDX2376300.1 2-oxo-4-hydroxy-4-carboxy-5-ureidoimidazoline decarboxylase [Microbacterium sp. LRZ72]
MIPTLERVRFSDVTHSNIRETHSRYGDGVLLTDFNDADAATAASLVRVWADVPRWVDAVVAGRRYADVDALAAHAAHLAAGWTESDLDTALAHHPRIGEKASGTGAEARASRGEQAAMTSADRAVADRIAAGNAAYEQRFGRVFLIRAAGRSPEQMLAALERRLGAAPDDEWREAAGQLAEIAVLRLRDAVTDDSARG